MADADFKLNAQEKQIVQWYRQVLPEHRNMVNAFLGAVAEAVKKDHPRIKLVYSKESANV